MPRTAEIARKTKETDIRVEINLDGKGENKIDTGIGFFDHMLTALSKHSGIDMNISCKGDLEVDSHHSVEDVGIALGQAVAEALGDKIGIRRYGEARIPMDEALGEAVIDISGRPYIVYNCTFRGDMMGQMDTQLVEEFMRSFAFNAGITLHIGCPYGTNDHHKAEAVFKAFAKALKEAVKIEHDQIPSTKGVL